ncbi:MAG: rhamnulokinase [Clostridia bacterium]|nr:rhamnulokinase [Clostridia bacterium]
MTYHLAIDIGASSGRHILGSVENGKIKTEEVYRFDNVQTYKDGFDCWNLDMLFSSIKEGLQKCKEIGKIPATVGIDTWGVDYVLLDADGNLCGNAVAYRDKRTEGMKKKLEEKMSFADLYAKTGIQYQPYNTAYQLLSQTISHPEQIKKAAHFLMVPEYLNYLLTGVMMHEYTIASTTAMLNAVNKCWDTDVLDAIGVPHDLFGEIQMPGTTVGPFSAEIEKSVGFSATVVLPPTHDTGSAFMAVPAQNDTSVYISSGTWSLLGVENEVALTNTDSMLENFTNEGGYACRYRYLKNIMGLWMIQSIRRELNGVSYVEGKGIGHATGNNYSYAQLEAFARECTRFPSIIDVDQEVFLSPASMIESVKTACKESGQMVPSSVGELMQCVYQSLAHKYAEAIKGLEKLTNKKYTCIHIVGGGSKDGYLNELTARSTGLPVYAGPSEGTALGNLMAQMIACGTFRDLAEARASICKSFQVKEFH